MVDKTRIQIEATVQLIKLIKQKAEAVVWLSKHPEDTPRAKNKVNLIMNIEYLVSLGGQGGF